MCSESIRAYYIIETAQQDQIEEKTKWFTNKISKTIKMNKIWDFFSPIFLLFGSNFESLYLSTVYTDQTKFQWTIFVRHCCLKFNVLFLFFFVSFTGTSLLFPLSANILSDIDASISMFQMRKKNWKKFHFGLFYVVITMYIDCYSNNVMWWLINC